MSLDAEEAEAMRLLSEFMAVLKGWGLKANHHEMTAAIHVLQGFITQHMLHRESPDEWSSWYER